MGSSYLIHIGFHKTASTWLQRHYFTRQNAGFSYIGKSPARYIMEQPLFHYDPAAVRSAVDGFFAAEGAAGLTRVISREQLSGHPSSGGWKAKEYAWRLASSFPDARILIVVREQTAMIRASYVQYLRAGGGQSLRDFLNPVKDQQVPQPSPYWFRYDGLVKLYMDEFTPDRVLCLPYELFVRQPKAFLERLDAFTGASADFTRPVEQRENASDGAMQYLIWRWINPLVKRHSTNGRSPYAMPFLRRPARIALFGLSKVIPQSWHNRLIQRWEREIEQVTAGFYEESNRRLSALIGYDLGSLGWRV